MATIINLTPHPITVMSDLLGEPCPWTCAPSGATARADDIETPAEPIDGIPTSYISYGALRGVPEPRDGFFYVVSIIALQAARAQGRNLADLLTPGKAIRDERGQVIGCTSLQRHV